VLCRDLRQLRAVLARGVSSVIADFARLGDYGEAVRRARAQGAGILLATPRIQKPGEAEMFQAIAANGPDGLLARNLAGAAFCAERNLPFVADASLHAANAWTVAWLRELGASRVTAACDLDQQRLLDLAAPASAAWLEVIVYQHVPMFHTEYCLYVADELRVPNAHVAGTLRVPKTAHGVCELLCRQHDVRLRDGRGAEHLLRSDAYCRNTLFCGRPRNLIELVPELRRHGVRHFRIELLDDVPREIVGYALGAR
jgi:putative protease